MYKTRFKRWKLKKYFSACEKEAVAQLLDTFRRNGIEAPETALNGTRVPLHVIRRHCRKQGIFDETCKDLPYVDRKSPEDPREEDVVLETTKFPSRDQMSPTTMMPPHRKLPFSGPARSASLQTDLDVFQTILTLSGQYIRWHFGSDLTEEQFAVSTRPSAISWRNFYRRAKRASLCWESIGRGLELLIKGEMEEAFKAINQGCAMVRLILQAQHRGLLKLFYLLFSDDRWQNFPDLRFNILRFFAEMSVDVLGEDSLLSTIIRLSRSPAVFQGSSQKVLQEVLDLSRFPLVKDTNEVGPLKRAECDILRVNHDYAGAEKVAKALIAECEVLHGLYHDETRRALRRLAHVYLDQNRYREAENVYLDVIYRSHQELADNYLDDSCIFAYQNLAYIYDKQGDLGRAKTFWRIAYGGNVYLFGANYYDTQYCKWRFTGVSGRGPAVNPQDWMLELPCTCMFEKRLLGMAAAVLCAETPTWQ